MTLFLGLVSCNSSATVAEESPQSRFLKSVISLGNDFLNVFTSFGDMVGGVLRFNSNTKKSDVGAYFKKVHDTVEGTKKSLEKIVADMKTEGNPNAEATDTAVKKLVSETLSKIIEGAKTASEAIGDASDPIGNVAVAAAGGGAGVAGTGVDSLVKGIKGIVDVVLKGVGNADAGDANKAEDGKTERTAAGDGEAGKLFATANAGDTADKAKKVAADAAKAVGAVTGADILQAIVKNGASAAADAAKAKAKDGIIAGAIALRAMAKGGKFANASAADNEGIVTSAVKGAALSAVTKALDTLTVAIRKTMDLGLKEVKDAMKINNAINANDTIVTSDKKTSEAKSE
ncbi:variable large family protein (plasmid) [Borrelia miyamotoi]|uniref:Variable large protein n=4 Tax=Borrelia miyamotoi TaxID=47466 RepID=A0AAQ3CN00_9SPIR|nr:variable large family protein [Borrelia miyamotoi]ATQ21477.1 variable large family protein [Borrelia miyamotoi]ATQ21575.1 variable large family protein [Borrelia miyamotoi]WDE70479.1 variable large family protein [Borrelia miyamotoi]WDS47665.1 variable large family protein [Borrelia miyamotoi]WEG86336.1 variable large family protein [Borrelia miyamotoi]